MAVVPFPDPHAQPDPDRWHEAGDPESGGRMSFLEHLDEFRKRLIKTLIAIAVGIGIAFLFIEQIYGFIMRPLQQMLPPGGRLIYTEPTEAFVLYLKIAMLAGIVIAAPAIMLQVWLFVAPALYSNEKKLAIPFVVLTTLGFVGGAAFSHYIVFRTMWIYLASFSNDYMTFMPKIESVFSLYVKMMLAMGLVFQMPSLVFFLARMGVLTARFMIKNFKYAILISFIVAAVITPSGDPLNQSLIAGPMIGLYLISIAIAWMFGKRRPQAGEPSISP
jgi:sec-independent protein translocase protein TatC